MNTPRVENPAAQPFVRYPQAGTPGAPFARTDKQAFTLIEIMVVMAIAAALMLLIMPAVQGIKNGEDVTKSAYDMAGLLEFARSYATSNNTYVWVGFFEENGERNSTSPATPGTGRIVLSMVAAKEGTLPYDAKTPAAVPGASLIQVNTLVKINNMHLKTFTPGDGTGTTFDHRPAVTSGSAQIGDSSPTATAASFQYPLGSPSAQYTFTKTIQFSPRGEVRINDSTHPLMSTIEIGLQPARGKVVNTASANLTAIQITGILGNVKIYRR